MVNGTRRELIYWEQNGEIKKAAVEKEVINTLLQSGQQCGSWIEGRSKIGFWRCTLYITVEGVYLVKDWIPAPGLSWSETEIYKLKI